MAMHIRGIFKDEGMILSLGSKHGLPVMAALCSQHKIAAESLCDKWRVFAEMQDMDDGAQADMVLLQKFADSVKKQFRRPSAAVSPMLDPGAVDDVQLLRVETAADRSAAAHQAAPAKAEAAVQV